MFFASIWRLNPMHLWHESIINSLSKEVIEAKFLQILWSSNAKFSLRHYFSYTERREFFKKVYPNVPVVGIPDYKTDEEWLLALDDLLMSHFWLSSRQEVKQKVTFLTWSTKDVSFLIDDWRLVKIIDRFDGTTPKISATEVREILIHWKSLDWLLNPKIQNDVKIVFQSKFDKLKKYNYNLN